MSPAPAPRPTQIVRAALEQAGVVWEEVADGVFAVELPGERKLKTGCTLIVGDHTLEVSAFVARRPDENHEGVYRWLLERNARLPGIAFSVDGAGDIHLVGRVPLHAVTPEEIDRLLGLVLSTSDASFNVILELGFASAIRREWAWRLDRGESTRNLRAFEHLRPPASPEP